MEWNLKVYPVLAVILGLLLISSVDLLVPNPQTFTRQGFSNQTKDVPPGMYQSDVEATQSTGTNLPADGAVASFGMLAIGLIAALGVYFTARHRSAEQ